MKRYLRYMLFVIFLFSLAISPIQIIADSGFDAGYGGGGSSGGSYGSSSSGGNYSSSESSGLLTIIVIITFFVYVLYTEVDEKILRKIKSKIVRNLLIITYWYFYLVIIGLMFSVEGMVILIILLILSIIGKKFMDVSNKHEKDKFEKQFIDKESITVSDINDPEFYNKIFNIYKEVQIAWMNMDLEPVRGVITDEMYNMYKMQLLTLKRKNQRNIMKDIEFVNAKILDKKEIDGKDEIDVMLKVTCRDYIINDKTSYIVRGDQTIINEYFYKLTFIKNSNANNKCPNCGGELDGANSTCLYCRSTIVHETSEYVLARKEMLHQSRK